MRRVSDTTGWKWNPPVNLFTFSTHFSIPSMHKPVSTEWSSISEFFTWKSHNTTRPPSLWLQHCSTDHLKWTNSNSSTMKIWVTSMTNSQAVAHKSWVARCSPSTPGFSCNNLQNIHGFSHSQSSHHKDFSLPAPFSSF